MGKRIFICCLLFSCVVFAAPGRLIKRANGFFVEAVNWLGKRIEKKLNTPMRSAEIRDKQRKLLSWYNSLGKEELCETCGGYGGFICINCQGNGFVSIWVDSPWGPMLQNEGCLCCNGMGGFCCPSCDGTGLD